MPEAVCLGKWKLHIDKSRGWNKNDAGAFPVSLYDLSIDMQEKNNVADQYPKVVEQLTQSITDFDGQF